jgi:SWI/SNF-related matrix-associated actin-dependent regulator 1 of chromatin subfamily A
MRVIKNRFKKKCSQCSVVVAEGQGLSYQKNGVWGTVCKYKVCQDKIAGLSQHIQSQAKPERRVDANGVIHLNPMDWNILPVIKKLPNASFDHSAKKWSVSTDPRDLQEIASVLSPLGFDVEFSISNNSSVEDALKRAEAVGAYPYQRDGISFLAGKTRALLGDDMGLGKTIQSLVALPENARAIFICPASLKGNVANEVGKWRPDLTAVVISGRGNFQLPNKGEVIIINYDILPSELTPTDKWGNESKNVPSSWVDILKETHLIVDEVHNCKNPKAIKSRRCKVLSRLCGTVWAMTGTPILSSQMDLWGVLSAFNMERRVFGDFKNFIEKMGGRRVGVSSTASKWVFGEPSPQVPNMLKSVMLRRMKTEVLTDLPAKTYQDILVDVSKKSLLKKAEKLLIDVKDLTPTDKLPDFEKFSEIRAELAKDRIGALEELLDSFEDAGEPVVVFSAHKAPVEALAGRYGWDIITSDTPVEDRTNIVDAFQKGILKGVALTIKAGGVGLTLTRASKMIFVDMEWNPSLNIQAEDRICRIGQKASSLQYIRLVSNCAMDIHVHKLIAKKNEMIYKILDADAPEEVIEYVPKQAEDLSSLVVEETQQELEARLKREAEEKRIAAEKLERSSAQCKISARRGEWVRGRKLPAPTPEQEQKIYEALQLMLSQCDGAQSEDGLGFNKPDAYNMRTIKVSGLLSGDVALQKFVWGTLRKYSRQLANLYPVLF